MNVCMMAGIVFALLAGKQVVQILWLRGEETELELTEEGKAV